MLLLSTTSRLKINFLLQPHNYTLLYNRLKLLPEAGGALTLFARPDIHPDHINWSTTEEGSLTRADIRSFDQLSESEKDTVADLLQTAKERVRRQLESDPQLQVLSAQFFIVPSTDDIKVLKGPQGFIPILTQWGCQPNDVVNPTDPLTAILNRPRVSTADVTVQFLWSDGQPAARKSFFIRYMDTVVAETTDETGRYHRGVCPLHSGFTIFDMVDGKEVFIHPFTVSDGADYTVVFPLPAVTAVEPATVVPPPPEKPSVVAPVVIKKKRRWWWWLLLLLLLLLLLRREKTIFVGLAGPGVMASTPVHFDFAGASHRETTDGHGLARFEHLSYPLYSWIFEHWRHASIYAEGKGCYTSDSLSPLFYSLRNNDTLLLPIHMIGTGKDFRVVDKEDGQPLPDARVLLLAGFAGQIFVDSAITGSDGRVLFRHIPVCSSPLKIIAYLEGYHPDSLLPPDMEGLNGPIDEKRILRLEPVKTPISFRVLDCATGEGLVNATVQLEFTFNGKKTSLLRHTNTLGMGKGTYPDAYLIANLRLYGAKDFYKKGELAGIHPVKAFIDPRLYPMEKKTFCLEPEPRAVSFMDVDAKTQQGIPATNTVTIYRAGKPTVFSAPADATGHFKVAGLLPGDHLSILAQDPPDYVANDITIRDADAIALFNGPASARVIPLQPQEKAPPPPPPCSEPSQQSRGSLLGLLSGEDERQFDMKAPGVRFTIHYNMYREPDELLVYCGKGTGGTLLASTGSRSNEGDVEIDLSKCGGSSWITVVIRGSGSISDQWDYKFVCP